jgi:peptidoglycan/LPS O-acetylase OafA/YrhL
MDQADRKLELDGLRGLAVGLVVIGHYYQLYNWGNGILGFWLGRVAGMCAPGLDIFFALSGFLIGGILLANRSSPALFKTFYLRRFFRIIPVYWLLLLSYLLVLPFDEALKLGPVSYLADPNPLPVWRYVLFIQNSIMVWKQSPDPAWLLVTWSLAVEEQFYLISPWLVKYFSPRVIAGLCVLALVGCPFLRYYSVMETGNQLGAAHLLVCRADALCAGLLAALLVHTSPGWLMAHARGWAVGAMIFILGCALNPFFLPDDILRKVILYPSAFALGNALVLLSLATNRAGMIARVLRGRALVHLGNLSYFVYLFHLPFQYLAVSVFRHWTKAYDPAALALGVILTVLLAQVSRRRLEQPLLSYAHRFSYG